VPCERQLEVVVRGGRVWPRWIGPNDHDWLEALLREAHRLGRGSRVEPEEVLRRVGAPGDRRCSLRRAARLVLGWRAERPPTARVRLVAATAAQRARDLPGLVDRDEVVAEVARDLELTADEVEQALGRGHDATKVLRPPPVLPDLQSLVRSVNLGLAQELLRRSSRVQIEVAEHTRAVVRQAHLRRLLCTVRPRGVGVCLEVSGAMALFRHTRAYGGALASLVPVVCRCPRFHLRAACRVGQRWLDLHLYHRAPLPRTGPTVPWDSQLEEAFAREFAEVAPEWVVAREPEPVAAGGALVFPDFGLHPRGHPERRWLVELVGFWTPDYLRAKLDRLREVGRDDLVVCVDRRLGCTADDLPELPVLWFDRRVDARAVLELVGSRLPRRPPEPVRRVLGRHQLQVGFAGLRAPDHPVHAFLDQVAPGDPLLLAGRDDRVLLTSPSGLAVAELTSAEAERWRPLVRYARAVRVVGKRRARADGGGTGGAVARCPSWWVPEVEVWLGTEVVGRG